MSAHSRPRVLSDIRPEDSASSSASRSAVTPPIARYAATLRQLLLYTLVSILHTAAELLAFNLLVWRFDLRTTFTLVLANTVAYALGAACSFALNRRWTFGRHDLSAVGELARYFATTLGGIALNDVLLYVLSRALLPLLGPTQLWANAAKLGAIGGTVLLSYLGMRLWVFARHEPARASATLPSATTTTAPSAAATTTTARSAAATTPTWLRTQQVRKQDHGERVALAHVLAHHGLSIVLPAYNEEQVILQTVGEVVTILDAWSADFEVLVVDDGSTDRTGEFVAAYSAYDPRVRLITHASNQGYGGALKSGFAAASKDLTLFMDADGQFSIRDLAPLLLEIDRVDAVLGYRIQRQDSWLRLVNARGWSLLVALALGVRVRDLDCALKLFRTEFLHAYPPTTDSALINAELVYTLVRTGASYCEVGVHHFARVAGRPTGANPRVIARALFALARNARRWRQRSYPSRGALVH
jgi:putative flippase GtrA